MVTGISTASFFGGPFNEEALRIIGKMGVRNVELFFSAHMEYQKPFLDEVLQICKGEGMQIRSVHALSTQFEPQLFSRHQRQAEEAMDTFKCVLEAAQVLGAGIYVFHGPMRVKVARKFTPDFEMIGERTYRLAEEAKKYGVKFTYENVHWCWYQSPGFAKQLMEHCPSDNLFFTLDMKQAAQSGYDMFQYIDDMGDRLAHIHLCDYRKDAEEGIIPCAPFEGEADWQGMRNKLDEIFYEGLLMLEIYLNNYRDYDDLYRIYDDVRRFFQ